MNKRMMYILISIFVLSSMIFVMANNHHAEFADMDTALETNRKNNELALNYGETLVESGSNFRIIRTNEDDTNAVPEFCYEVFNNDGKVVIDGNDWRIPSFININDDVLKISVSAGTGVHMVQFYSAESDMLSEVFDTPIMITNELIGLLRWSDTGALNLIVRNIFDKGIYYNEFLLENFSNVINPLDAVIQTKYLGDGRLEIIYLSGESFDEKTVIIQL